MNEPLQLTNIAALSDDKRPIAMVDDEELDYQCASRYLDRSLLQNPMLHFLDGVDFLSYLDKVKLDEKPLPALVLVDINMPLMNGFEVVSTMRKDEAFVDMPVVVMLSSSTDRADIERASQVGATSYFVKPYKPNEYKMFFDSLAA